MSTYTRLSIDCVMAATSFGEAARIIGPAFIYELHVHPHNELEARAVVRRLIGHHYENPFLPHVNIVLNTLLEPREWILEANDKRAGSREP
jgi:hypothetical protein